MTPGNKSGRIAAVSASLLTLAAISCGSLGVWRLATDLMWTRGFVIPKGFLSHWQVWIGAAAGAQYASWRLIRYARTLRRRDAEITPAM